MCYEYRTKKSCELDRRNHALKDWLAIDIRHLKDFENCQNQIFFAYSDEPSATDQEGAGHQTNLIVEIELNMV